MIFMEYVRAGSLYHRYFCVYLWFVSSSQVNVFERTQALTASILLIVIAASRGLLLAIARGGDAGFLFVLSCL